VSAGPSRELVVLYADISGSTRLYEQYGDAMAREAVATCIQILTEITERSRGRLVKTIGDEVMCAFDSPASAVLASNEMQMAVQKAGEEGRFVTGPLRIKVGLHYGMGIEEPKEIAGEASIVAHKLVSMAKADQILTSDATMEALPPELRVGSRRLDAIYVDGVPDEIVLFELIWEVSGLTQVADARPVERPRATYTRLRVTFKGTEFEVTEQRPVLTLGRVAGNDVIIATDLTSRSHAEIEYRRGRFQITDNSSNGTAIVPDDGSPQVLRREKTVLKGSGRISLGALPEENPEGTLQYSCE
jgi:class 3 adenylate cyclase